MTDIHREKTYTELLNCLVTKEMFEQIEMIRKAFRDNRSEFMRDAVAFRIFVSFELGVSPHEIDMFFKTVNKERWYELRRYNEELRRKQGEIEKPLVEGE